MERMLFMRRTPCSDETKDLGRALAACLRAGDVVFLSGDLGAGKTQFVQGVAAGLGADEVPTSPTFNIVLTYRSGRLPLHHFDLYRLDREGELEDIGLAEYLESGGVCFVEWAEKFPRAFHEFVTVEITVGAQGDRACQLVDAWKRELEQADACADTAEPSRLQDVGEGRTATAAGDALPAAEGRVAVRPASGPVVLAFDTANEIVAIGVGALDEQTRSVHPLATQEVHAHRASNTQLLPRIDELLRQCGVKRADLACICVGRGPGSFTGVRIAMATAKGVASALGVGLVGVSSLDAVAWGAQAAGIRGDVLVVADAMRKEVYPARFLLSDSAVERLGADKVVKAELFAGELEPSDVTILGDGLVKYLDLFAPKGSIAPEGVWGVSGAGLLSALQDAWRSGEANPLDAKRHDPAFALPVYTRLSDAEENERIRLARTTERNLVTGVQDVEPAPDGGKGRATMHVQSQLIAPAGTGGVSYHPLDASHAGDVEALEAVAMGTDAWNARMVADELAHRDRTWWVAEADGALVGYAGGLIVDGDLQILKVAVEPSWRRHGIARQLIAHVSDDARNLGAATCSLEVRKSNAGAQSFYESMGLLSIGVRPRYYSDREDAVIMSGPLPTAPDVLALSAEKPDVDVHDVAGMELKRLNTVSSAESACCNGSQAMPEHPIILAIESSCDETAAALVDGQGNLLSDVVASQIDFHARFGGVVPEIASRKHIEAICGVCAEALDVACVDGAAHARGGTPSQGGIGWSDLNAIAVTYAPGLVGALVVGVAFAKGAAWALDVPFIGVNHLEGHLYANKIGDDSFAPPAVVSLVSGGNTMLVHMRDWGDYETLGATIDDAVGEAFDKVSKALGLGYPGGPAISAQASQGNPAAIDFPRAMLHSHDLRFSLSGLKTAVVNYINKERQAGRELNMPDIAASFQQAVVDVQVAKAKTALEQTGAHTFCLGGGVAANPVLRDAYVKMCSQKGVKLVMPPLSSCGDNAGMIALVALDRFAQGKFFDLSADAYAHADLDSPY